MCARVRVPWTLRSSGFPSRPLWTLSPRLILVFLLFLFTRRQTRKKKRRSLCLCTLSLCHGLRRFPTLCAHEQYHIYAASVQTLHNGAFSANKKYPSAGQAVMPTTPLCPPCVPRRQIPLACHSRYNTAVEASSSSLHKTRECQPDGHANARPYPSPRARDRAFAHPHRRPNRVPHTNRTVSFPSPQYSSLSAIQAATRSSLTSDATLSHCMKRDKITASASSPSKRMM